MKWIVLEENPQPDNYIAVMVSEEGRTLRERKASLVQFLNRASKLCLMLVPCANNTR
jgi:hypothetical protein